METQTQTKSSILEANLSQLPMMKHFSGDEIITKVDNFRKGEKSIYWFLKLAVFGAAAWATWTYILPPVFIKLGQWLALIATGILIVGTIICAPAILRKIRQVAKWISKNTIKSDPFGQFALDREKMIVNQNTFRISKGNINQIKNDMVAEAAHSEKEAKEGQDAILKAQAKANRIKADMDAMVQKDGAEAKNSDEYVNLLSDWQKVLADSQRIANKMEQSKIYIQKYGSRAAIMKKMGQKLTMVETAMEIKIQDFDATIEMLKKDYEFGQKSSAATNAAKSAMLFDKGWEFDYALEVVKNTISNDIAITSGNLRDIDSITANYAIDSDDLFTNLNLIADKIKVSGDVIPDAKQYSNPDYKLTSADKVASGGFEDIFN